MSAFLAWIGLALFVYSGVRMVEEWPNRNKIEKAIWFVLITVGSGFCFAVLKLNGQYQWLLQFIGHE